MISKLSIPVKSLSATASIGTVRHHEQEAQHCEPERDRDRHAGEHQRDQQAENDGGVHRASSLAAAGLSIDALDMAGIMMRQLAGPPEMPRRPAGSGST